MLSKITGGATTFLYKARILSKHDISFYMCNETGFIQTEEPYWLNEAYLSAISKLDIGLVQRNLDLAELAHPLIMKNFDHNGFFLDYAGGYGLFTRLMRYKGFDFYSTDKYCNNIFAEFNDLKYFVGNKRFELTTAFEVFEHLHSPLQEIDEMLAYSDNLLFSTVIVPKNTPQPGEWWYFSLETGQHISFYTVGSLEYIAKKFNKYFYTNGKTVHLFTKKQLRSDPFKQSWSAYLMRKLIMKVKSLEKTANGRKQNRMDKDIDDAKERISAR
jgi:Methyltransferase domain